MSEENMSDNYEVGYGKPPKDTQFKKGSSGNPKGRPRIPLGFDQELLRESRASITINVNGRRQRISKHRAVIKQMLNKAISGDTAALRTYIGQYQVALEKNASLEASRSLNLIKPLDLDQYSDEQLLRLAESLDDQEQEGKK